MRILAIGDFHGKFPAKIRKIARKENPDLIIGLGDYTGIEDWRPYINYLFKVFNKEENVLSASEFFGKKNFARLLEKDFKAGKKVLSSIKNLGKPVIFIFGNGDDVWYKYPFIKGSKTDKRALRFVAKLGFRNITYKSTKFGGINFIGFGGYMDARANYEKYEKKMYLNVIKRVNASKKKLFAIARKAKGEKIFVLHYPPAGIFDRISDRKNPYHGGSAGIEFFRKAILRFKPKLALCGHMHEYQGIKKIGRTLVINPGDAERGRCAVMDYPEMKIKFFK